MSKSYEKLLNDRNIRGVQYCVWPQTGNTAVRTSRVEFRSQRALGPQ